jgi:hypothetical protein
MISTGNFCLVEESLGKQWYFTLTDEQVIEYRWKQDESWTPPIRIDRQPVKRFSVTIDENDRIYLLAYNSLKQLIHYEWNGQKWFHRILYRISSRFENISYIGLVANMSQIHLLFYVENSLKKAQESLIHSCLRNGKWHSNILMTFLTDQTVTPQLFKCDARGNLYFLYTRENKSQTRSYALYYDTDQESWFKPVNVFQKSGKHKNFNGQIDDAGTLHLVWTETAEDDYRLNYINLAPDIRNQKTDTVCIYEGSEEIQSPILYIGKDMHCIWTQGEKIYISINDYNKNHWKSPDIINEKNFTSYFRINKTLDGRAYELIEIGDGFPHFKWNLESLLFGSILKSTNYITSQSVNINEKDYKQPRKNEITLQENSVFPNPNDKNPDLQSLWKKNIVKAVEPLKKELMDIQNRMDDFYAALYQLQDYIHQKDKLSFQTEAQIRKLAFELDQLRSLYRKSDTEIQTLDYADERSNEAEHKHNKAEWTKQAEPHSKEEENRPEKQGANENVKPLQNIDHGNGKIQLREVSILINPENDQL